MCTFSFGTSVNRTPEGMLLRVHLIHTHHKVTQKSLKEKLGESTSLQFSSSLVQTSELQYIQLTKENLPERRHIQ